MRKFITFIQDNDVWLMLKMVFLYALALISAPFIAYFFLMYAFYSLMFIDKLFA
jgi:type III secretory pathway component EscS